MNQSKLKQTGHENNHSLSQFKDDDRKTNQGKTTKYYPDHVSDGTHKTKISKKSVKSAKSTKSDRTDHLGQKHRDFFNFEKTVTLYDKEKQIEELEKGFEYKSDEESVFNSFQHDVKKMPHQIKKKFALNAETGASKKLFKDVLRRFTEKT